MNIYIIMIGFNQTNAMTFHVSADAHQVACELASAELEKQIKDRLTDVRIEMSFVLPNCKYVGTEGPHIIMLQRL